VVSDDGELWKEVEVEMVRWAMEMRAGLVE